MIRGVSKYQGAVIVREPAMSQAPCELAMSQEPTRSQRASNEPGTL